MGLSYKYLSYFKIINKKVIWFLFFYEQANRLLNQEIVGHVIHILAWIIFDEKKNLPKKSSLIHSRPKMKVCRINQLLALWNKFKTCIDLMKGLFGKWIPKYYKISLIYKISSTLYTLLYILFKMWQYYTLLLYTLLKQQKMYLYTIKYIELLSWQIL